MSRLVPPLVLLGALIASPARAQKEGDAGVQRVAVVRLGFEGDVPEAGQEMFGRRLVQGLTVARFQVLSGARLRDKLASAGNAACTEARCYPAVARALGVGYLVVGRVAEDSKTYQIALDLINGRTGAIMGSVHQQCETCGIEEAGEKMDLAASALRARLQVVTRMPARFVIRSLPEDAEARIDGQAVGRTPLDVELPGGEHHLSLELGGHEVLNRTFIVVSGVDETMDLALVAESRVFPYRPVGWTALTAGVLAIAAGTVGLLMDGKEVPCQVDKQDMMGHCPLIRKTDLVGALLLGFGSAGVTAGAVSLYLGSRGGVSPEPSSQRPFGLALQGSF
jgi:TolB-like protein